MRKKITLMLAVAVAFMLGTPAAMAAQDDTPFGVAIEAPSNGSTVSADGTASVEVGLYENNGTSYNVNAQLEVIGPEGPIENVELTSEQDNTLNADESKTLTAEIDFSQYDGVSEGDDVTLEAAGFLENDPQVESSDSVEISLVNQLNYLFNLIIPMLILVMVIGKVGR